MLPHLVQLLFVSRRVLLVLLVLEETERKLFEKQMEARKTVYTVLTAVSIAVIGSKSLLQAVIGGRILAW